MCIGFLLLLIIKKPAVAGYLLFLEEIMDINCTHSCFYQQDGKCHLRALPTATANNFTAVSHDVDCPYYSETYNVANMRNAIGL